MSKISRRNMLKGGAAAFAFSALPTWSISHAQSVDDRKLKNLIIFYAAGGWDATACLDPKMGLTTVDSPAGTVQTFGGGLDLLVGDERPNVERFFNDFGDISSVVRGIEVRSIAHEECTKRIFTGTNDPSQPDAGSILGHVAGDERPVPYMVFGNTSYVGPYTKTTGRIGTTGQLSTLLSPSRAYPWSESTRFTSESEERSAIRKFLEKRQDRDMKLRGGAPLSRGKIDGVAQSFARSDELRPLVESFGEQRFALELEPQIDLTIRVLKDNISRAVLIQDPGTWDTHNNSDPQQFFALNNLYGGLHTLITRLDEEGLLQDTVVAVVSEMSRTPLKNQQDGKDHWPVTSALVLGSGINGGKVVGATSDMVESMPVNLKTGELDDDGIAPNGKRFVAGLLEAVGVDSKEHFPDVDPLTAFIG